MSGLIVSKLSSPARSGYAREGRVKVVPLPGGAPGGSVLEDLDIEPVEPPRRLDADRGVLHLLDGGDPGQRQETPNGSPNALSVPETTSAEAVLRPERGGSLPEARPAR